MDGELQIDVGVVGVVNITLDVYGGKCSMHGYKSRGEVVGSVVSMNIEMSWSVTYEPVEFEN